MKALADLVGINSRSFKADPGHEWIDRNEAMRLMPALRDHASALATMLREELKRAHGAPKNATSLADKHCICSNRSTDNTTEPRWTFDLAGIEAMLANGVAPDPKGGA